MMKYYIITPAKNEEDYIENTLKSVCRQSLLPIKWIIIDDGSVDNTYEIIKKYSFEHPWIIPIKLNTSERQRQGGINIVNVFNAGYELIKSEKYDFIVKLDADLTLPFNYFQEVSKTFKSDLRIGLCGGYCLNKVHNKYVKERSASYHIRGAFKSIRKKCWNQIGGFQPLWLWDGLDEMQAFYLGWKTKVIDLPVLHHRATGKAYNSYKYIFKSGYEYYKIRNGILLIIIRAFYKIIKKPYILGSICFTFGYFQALFNKESMCINKDLAKFINKFHYNRIKKSIFKFNLP